MSIYVKLDPIAFSIGPLTVGWYGIMVALAVVTIVSWAVYWAKKDPELNPDKILNVALVGIPSGIIFSRILFLIDQTVIARTHPELNAIDFLKHPGLIIGGAGLTIWGAVLGAALGIWIYSKITRGSFVRVADMLAPGIILAQAVGRVGCTILGDDTGLPTSLPWGFIYTSPNSPTNQTVGLTATQPVVTYEIFYALILFGILMLLRKRLRPDGSLFAVYLAFYSAWRIGSDFLREGSPFFLGLHQAQFIGIVILVLSVVWIAWHTRWVKKGEVETPNVTPGKPAEPAA
jgi:phosphatidylglycerol---prolipoprotein diacylglyceryl transferase